MRVHGSSPSFAGTQVLFTAHLPMSPGGQTGLSRYPPSLRKAEEGGQKGQPCAQRPQLTPCRAGAQEQAQSLLLPLCGRFGWQGSGGPLGLQDTPPGPGPSRDPASSKHPSAVNLMELPTPCRTHCPRPPKTPRAPLEKNVGVISCHGQGGSWRALSCTLPGRASFPNQVNNTNRGQLSHWPAPAG